jgi:hypothetical protein
VPFSVSIRARRRHWFVGDQVEIPGVEQGNMLRARIPVEVDVAPVALHSCDRPDLPMIAQSRRIHSDPLSDAYLFPFHDPLQNAHAGVQLLTGSASMGA